jgi:hypothetical protein
MYGAEITLCDINKHNLQLIISPTPLTLYVLSPPTNYDPGKEGKENRSLLMIYDGLITPMLVGCLSTLHPTLC